MGADNWERTTECYEEWKEWTAQHALVWEGVGLDIEPDVRLYQQIADNPWRLPMMLLPRLHDKERPRRAREAYSAVVDRIHADGYIVENYQFPFLEDERQAGSTLFQRLLGLVDVRTDREVWMLYTSFLPGVGPGLLWTYAPEAAAIGVGSTGGAPDIPGHPQVPSLNWEEFSRDLRLARHWSNDLYIHSLEGCVRQGFLPRLRTFEWNHGVTPPRGRAIAAALRSVLKGILWTNTHPWHSVGSVAAITWLVSRRRRHA